MFKWNTADEEDLDADFDIDKAMNENWDKLDENAKSLGDKINSNQEEIIQNISKQNELIKKLIDNSIRETTEEATSLQIKNASTVPAKFEIRGNCKQEITEVGNNIFNGRLEAGDYDYDTGEKVDLSNTVRSADFIDIEGLEGLSIVKESGGVFSVGLRFYSEDKEYIGRASLYDITDGATFNTNHNEFNSEKTVKYLAFRVTDGDLTAKYAINKDQSLIYEEYIPNSPSPDYPSEIQVVGDNGSVEVRKINKNWAKTDNPRIVERSDLSIEVDNEGVFTINGIANANMYINLFDISEYQGASLTAYKLPKRKYKACFELISKGNSSVSETNGNAHFNVRNLAVSSTGEQAKEYCSFVNLITKNVGIQIEDCNITEDRVVAYLYIASGVKLDNFKFKFAIFNENEAETTYIKHQEQVYSLPIQQPMLKKDYFIKESDGWKEVHHLGYINSKDVLDISVALNGSNKNFRRYNVDLNVTDRKPKEYILNTVCTHFKYADCRWNEYEGICGWENGQGFCISTFNTELDTVEKMEAFLKNNDVKIYYDLATPKKLSCTEEQKQVLDKLEELELFKGTNNIITAENLALMQMTYTIDTKAYIDSKIANTNAQILNS